MARPLSTCLSAVRLSALREKLISYSGRFLARMLANLDSLLRPSQRPVATTFNTDSAVMTDRGAFGLRALFAWSPLLLIWFCAVPASAQSVLSPTVPVGGTTVNGADLQVSFAFPIYSKPGRGIPLKFVTTFYNPVWELENGRGPWVLPLGAQGGTMVPATLVGEMTYSGYVPPYNAVHQRDDNCGNIPLYTVNNFNWSDANGVAHPFGIPTLTSPTNTCGRGPQTGSAYASDGSGYFMYADLSNPTPNWTITITAPDGTIIGGPNGLIQDANGNVVTNSWNNSTRTMTYADTLGINPAFTAAVGYGVNTSYFGPDTYTYNGPTGPKSVVVHYTSLILGTNFQCSGISEYGGSTGPVYFPSDVTYPDGSKYILTYESIPGGKSTGRLATVTVPTGGVVNYQYTGPNGGVSCASPAANSGSLVSLSVTASGGTTTYSRNVTVLPPNTVVTTTTGPNGQKTVTTYEDTQDIPPVGTSPLIYFPVQIQKWNGADKTSNVDICYDGDAAPCTSTQLKNINSLLSEIKTTTLSGGLVSKDVITRLSNSFLPSTVAHYDFTGSLYSTQSLEYGSYNGSGCTGLGNTISDAVCRAKVLDGSSAVVSETDTTYDEGVVAGTTGTPNHVSITGSRGNATTISEVVAGTTTLKRSSTYFDTGLPNVATDINGAQVSYTYGACGNSFTTAASLPLSLSVSQTWDPSCDGAVLNSSTDPNGKVESISYTDNNLWRPTSVTDELQNITNVNYVYDGSNHPVATDISLLFNSNNSIADVRTSIDGYGRPTVSQLLKGPGATVYDSTEVDYNTVGLPYRSTVPYQASAGQTNPSAPATVTTYDALGRVSTVTDGGGGTVSSCYYPSASGGCSGTTDMADVLVTVGPAPTGENTKKKQYEYDALGRLSSVCELSTTLLGTGACGQRAPQTGYWTRYSYDTLGNLISITQNAQSGAPQVRGFTYDGLGRRLTESNPESGITQYFYDLAPNTPGVACAKPSFPGDLVKSYDANGNTVCHEYDALHRLTATKYPGGPNASVTDEKHYVYDSATVNSQVMQNTLGRLAEGYTGTSSSKKTDHGYSYTVRGELQTEYIKTPHSNGYRTVGYTYYENGSLSGMTTSISALPSFSFSVNAQGQQQMVTSSDVNNPILVSNTLYNNAGEETEVDFPAASNKDSFLYDGNTMRWEKGTFQFGTSSIVIDPTWNANGTVQSSAITDASNPANNQTCSYSEDDAGRVASINCGQAVWQQNFIYDALGNVTKNVPQGGTGVSWIPGYNQANNQYTLGGTSYDFNGNLLNDTFHTYTWDSDNNPITIDGLSVTYDAFDREIERLLSGSNYNQYLDTLAGRVIARGPNLVQAKINLPGRVMVKYTASGLAGFFHSDWRGNAVAFSSAGAYSGSQAFAPFGESYALNNMSSLFMGLGADTVSDETDTASRKYHWVSGRFIQPDPSGSWNPLDPQSINQYAYVRNSPLTLVDPSGQYEGGNEFQEFFDRSLFDNELDPRAEDDPSKRKPPAPPINCWLCPSDSPPKDGKRSDPDPYLGAGQFRFWLDSIGGTAHGFGRGYMKGLSSLMWPYVRANHGPFAGAPKGTAEVAGSAFVVAGTLFIPGGKGRVALDADALIYAIEHESEASGQAVLRKIAGREVTVSITAMKQFLTKGSASELRDFLIANNGRIAKAAPAALVRSLMAVGLGEKDARVVGSALVEGIRVITNDKGVIKKVPGLVDPI